MSTHVGCYPDYLEQPPVTFLAVTWLNEKHRSMEKKYIKGYR